MYFSIINNNPPQKIIFCDWCFDSFSREMSLFIISHNRKLSHEYCINNFSYGISIIINFPAQKTIFHESQLNKTSYGVSIINNFSPQKTIFHELQPQNLYLLAISHHGNLYFMNFALSTSTKLSLLLIISHHIKQYFMNIAFTSSAISFIYNFYIRNISFMGVLLTTLAMESLFVINNFPTEKPITHGFCLKKFSHVSSIYNKTYPIP